MQDTLFVENTALYLADTDASAVLSDKGNKVHQPVLSKAQTGTYTPYSDITYKQQSASKQTLTVDQFRFGAEEIDWTDKRQTSNYDPVAFSAKSMQRNLNNRIEQYFLSKITGAKHTIDGATVGGAAASLLSFSGPTIFDAFEAADSKLSSFDVPTMNRCAVMGPHSIAAIRKLKSQRESPLGDTTLANGIIGPWNGWTIIQNNNLPYSAVLGLATNPTAGDTVTIAGCVFTFVSSLTSAAAGSVLIGSDADTTRASLTAAINGASGAGTTYVEIGIEDQFILREKRAIVATNDNTGNTMTIAGYGDIVVSSDLTATGDVWSGQTQNSYFGLRGAIDLVVQIDPNNIQIINKEKGFADLVKSPVGFGAYMFDDGARASVNVKCDASSWK
jgi:hypothetical protein